VYDELQVMELRNIDVDSLDIASALLAAHELPIDDLRDPSITLIGAFEEGALVGVIGLQACDDVALLRSLVVAPERRDRGIAAALCERLFVLAGTRELYLLTESADAYFTRLGFAPVARAEVPAAIQATAQFSALCPSSARVMRRVVSRNGR
jgi:amino-acid N-acetyltransferase